MKTPLLVESASMAPGKCFTCGSITGPFIDTMVHLPLPEGRIYVCKANCLDNWERLTRGLPEADADKLIEICETLRTKIADLETKLESEKDNKVVPVENIVNFLDAYLERHGVFPDGSTKPRAAA